MKVFSLVQMVLAVVLTVAFAVIGRQTETARMARVMESVSRSLEESSKVAASAKEYYGSMSGSLQKTGDAMVQLGPTVTAFGQQTEEMGKFLNDLSIPSGIKLEGLTPKLEYAKPMEKNQLLQSGESFRKIGESLNEAGPELQRMAQDAPRIQASLDEVSRQLQTASQELKQPVQGQSAVFYLGVALGVLLFLQSLTLFLLTSRSNPSGQN